MSANVQAKIEAKSKFDLECFDYDSSLTQRLTHINTQIEETATQIEEALTQIENEQLMHDTQDMLTEYQILLEAKRQETLTLIAVSKLSEVLKTNPQDIDEEYEIILSEIPKSADIQDLDQRRHYQELLLAKCKDLISDQQSPAFKRAMAVKGLQKIESLEGPMKPLFNEYFTPLKTLYNSFIPLFVAHNFILKREQYTKELPTLTKNEQVEVQNKLDELRSARA